MKVDLAGEIVTVLRRYAAAILAGDRATLDALLDTDYQFVSAEARVMGRERRLAALAAGWRTLAAFSFDDPDVRVVGDVAIVRVPFTAEYHERAGRAGPEQGISTFVFARRQAGWRMCHQHNSHSRGPAR